ncbi:MAG: T9SS type A sorting domain-containing protein, partial [Bacteroidales bacterium]|nr:T9SS type A sorting domain-containing protein [Bacteroidales bacterium]
QGVSDEKLVMGVPYYARQWPTTGQYAPSAATGSGTAYTYRYIRNNSATVYINENKHWEPNSFSPYYSFQNNGWYQCFVDDIYSMGKKYDQINHRDLAGIGIWALGYDDGYTELWELIADKFTEDAIILTADTIFDTGGPSFDYYNNENYTYTITTPEGTNLYLSFSYLNLEQVYDSLWIFNGSDTTSQLIGGFSGDSVPAMIIASGNSITLKFKSDIGITNTGWRAVYDTLPVSLTKKFMLSNKVLIYPNPATSKIIISPPFNSALNGGHRGVNIQISNATGKMIYETTIPPLEQVITISTKDWKPDIYFISFFSNGILSGTEKLIVK